MTRLPKDKFPQFNDSLTILLLIELGIEIAIVVPYGVWGRHRGRVCASHSAAPGLNLGTAEFFAN